MIIFTKSVTYGDMKDRNATTEIITFCKFVADKAEKYVIV